jgi:hypothetical protein
MKTACHIFPLIVRAISGEGGVDASLGVAIEIDDIVEVARPSALAQRPEFFTLHSTILIALVLLIGATVPSTAEEGPDQSFTCSAKTFNECLMEAPCSAWKRSGPKEYKLGNKIIFRGNPVEGETISGGTIGDILETKCGKK